MEVVQLSGSFLLVLVWSVLLRALVERLLGLPAILIDFELHERLRGRPLELAPALLLRRALLVPLVLFAVNAGITFYYLASAAPGSSSFFLNSLWLFSSVVALATVWESLRRVWDQPARSGLQPSRLMVVALGAAIIIGLDSLPGLQLSYILAGLRYEFWDKAAVFLPLFLVLGLAGYTLLETRRG